MKTYTHLTEKQLFKIGMSAETDKDALIQTKYGLKNGLKGFGGKLYRLVEVTE